jgi:hypothetical protein
MTRIAALVLSVLLLAPLAVAQRTGVKVIGDWITLGDVAPVTGEHAGILLGPAPPPGQTLALDPAFLIATAKNAGVILAIPLDQPIMVTRATGNATPAPAHGRPPTDPADRPAGRCAVRVFRAACARRRSELASPRLAHRNPRHGRCRP